MKKVLVTLLVIAFCISAIMSFAAPVGYVPNDRYTLPSTFGWDYLGQKMVTQKMKSGGNITMKGYQKDNVQLITMTFKGESRPYCFWFADAKSGSSVGRCDVDNDMKYEYDFGGEGRTGHKLYFKPNWPTAYE